MSRIRNRGHHNPVSHPTTTTTTNITEQRDNSYQTIDIATAPDNDAQFYPHSGAGACDVHVSSDQKVD